MSRWFDKLTMMAFRESLSKLVRLSLSKPDGLTVGRQQLSAQRSVEHR
jgi:hypothetical protein